MFQWVRISSCTALFKKPAGCFYEIWNRWWWLNFGIQVQVSVISEAAVLLEMSGKWFVGCFSSELKCWWELCFRWDVYVHLPHHQSHQNLGQSNTELSVSSQLSSLFHIYFASATFFSRCFFFTVNNKERPGGVSLSLPLKSRHPISCWSAPQILWDLHIWTFFPPFGCLSGAS